MEGDGAKAGDGGLLGSLLQALVEVTGEGVVAFDREGRVAYASPSAQALLRGLEASAVTAGRFGAPVGTAGGPRGAPPPRAALLCGTGFFRARPGGRARPAGPGAAAPPQPARSRAKTTGSSWRQTSWRTWS